MNEPGLSLKELLRLAFSDSLPQLSGDQEADVPIGWVALGVDEVQPGELLICLRSHFTLDMLAEAVERLAAAMLVLGKLPRVKAEKRVIPLVAISGENDLRAVYRRLLTILINQRAYLMERGVRIHARLSQLSAEGQGLDGLARAMAELSGRGVLVQDKRLGVLADSPNEAVLEVWEGVLQHLMESQHLPTSLHDRKEAGKKSGMVSHSIPGGLHRVVVPINVGGVARGYLSLVGTGSDLDALDYLVAEQGALVCAVEMARAKAVRETEKRLKRDLLTALLQEDLSARDAQLWVQAMGLDLSQAHAALRFAWDAPSPPSQRRLETNVNGEIARLGLKVIVDPMANEVVCFCQVPPGQARPETAFSLGEAVLARGVQEYPDKSIRCGIGLPASSLGDWRDSFRQAGQTLEMARRLREARPLYFPDLSVYRLLLQLEHHPELSAFKAEILGPLLAYEGGQELIRTLEAYFESNGNLTQAAELLFVHRNTLIYRMERIAEITGLDLDNTETRLAVQLALRIYRMTGGIKANSA